MSMRLCWVLARATLFLHSHCDDASASGPSNALRPRNKKKCSTSSRLARRTVHLSLRSFPAEGPLYRVSDLALVQRTAYNVCSVTSTTLRRSDKVGLHPCRGRPQGIWGKNWYVCFLPGRALEIDVVLWL
ncbi:hypothetical protein DENSPDRAFT_714186 [Dentipellis sp. KUC8613]|nr:hypothetical protein DENSPDRAFT_714186 [Dentipellis sp. KUC8613]